MKIHYQQIEDFLEVELAQDRITCWREFTKGQYRVNEYFDIFPKSKGWFNSVTKKRGKYNDLEKILTNIL